MIRSRSAKVSWITFLIVSFCRDWCFGLNANIAVLGYTAHTSVASLAYVGPVIDVALEKVAVQYPELNMSREFLHYRASGECPYLAENMDDLVANWYYTRRDPAVVNVIFVPACAEISTINHLVAEWNILYITSVGATAAIKQRKRNYSWISTAYVSSAQLAEFYAAILRKYDWRSAVAVVDSDGLPFYSSVATSLFNYLDKHWPIGKVFVSSRSEIGFEGVLQAFARISRVMLFFGNAALLRKLLVTAFKLNMTGSEYKCMLRGLVSKKQKVYIGVEPFPNKVYGIMTWRYGDGDDLVARQAFQSLIVIQLVPSSFVMDRAQRRRLRLTFWRRSQVDYNFKYDLDNQPFDSLTGSYSAVTSLASVLDRLTQEGTEADVAKLNGRRLANLFINQTFSDEVGELVIDGTGERRTDLVAAFFNSNGSREAFLFKPALGRHVHDVVELKAPPWPDNASQWPPPDEPRCGFQHEKTICWEKGDNTWIFELVSGMLLTILIILLVMRHRMRKTKRKIEEQVIFEPWWQIDTDRVQLDKPAKLIPSERRNSSILAQLVQVVSDASRDEPTAIVDTGTLDDRQQVSLKSIAISNRYMYASEIASRRDHLIFLKRLKDTAHNCLTAFVGLAVIEQQFEQQVTVVSEYCSKGCIYGLFDFHGELELGFRSSFAAEFLEGLDYLHKSPVAYHGRLSNFRCYIDKFFTLKITQTGYERLQKALDPRGFRLRRLVEEDWDAAYWGAPEFYTAPVVSGRKRDVYSAGFILYEIIAQDKLYKKLPDTKVDGINLGEHNPLQNALDWSLFPKPFKSLVPVLQSCWSVNPVHRPAISRLRSHLAQATSFRGGKVRSDRIVDKLARRLAKYTEGLQEEANRRLQVLVDEKERYYEMCSYILPPAVIHRMRTGDPLSEISGEYHTMSVIAARLRHEDQEGQLDSSLKFLRVVSEADAVLEEMSKKYQIPRAASGGERSVFMCGDLDTATQQSNRARDACLFALDSQASFQLILHDEFVLTFGISTGPCKAAFAQGRPGHRAHVIGTPLPTALALSKEGLQTGVLICDATAELVQDMPEFHTNLWRYNKGMSLFLLSSSAHKRHSVQYSEGWVH